MYARIRQNYLIKIHNLIEIRIISRMSLINQIKIKHIFSGHLAQNLTHSIAVNYFYAY